MPSLVARPYRPEDADAWDRFVERCPQGTVLHTRRFLAYHGERFLERSLVIERDGAWVAAMPAGAWPDQPEVVASHPGSTFGGLLLPKLGDTALAEEAFAVAAEELQRRWQAERLDVRLPLAHLSPQPDESQLHALFRLGATLDRVDLWSAIQLDRDFKRSHRRNARKGRKAGVTTAFETAPEAYEEFHALLSQNLRAKHDRSPVHSEADLLDLRERIEADQRLFVARLPDGSLGAGTWLLRHREGVFHTQYLASAAHAQQMRPMEVLLDDLVDRLLEEGARCVSFGASSVERGRVLNPGLHRFKSKLGGGAVAHYHARWELGS